MAAHKRQRHGPPDGRSVGRASRRVHAVQFAIPVLADEDASEACERAAPTPDAAGISLMLDSARRRRAAQPSAPCRVYVPNR